MAKLWQPSRTLLRVDGQYGTRAVLADLAGFSFVTRGKDYTVLKLPEVQRRLHLPADQQFSRPESDLVRTLYDCPDLPLGSDGSRLRVVVATHPATLSPRHIFDEQIYSKEGIKAFLKNEEQSSIYQVLLGKVSTA